MHTKRFLIAGGVMLAFVGVALFFSAPRAEANFFKDLWEDLTRPFSATSTSPTAEQSKKQDVPLYKPALDYEQAVIAAVKKAAPAVVSITVSKNVPIIENCPTNPFSDLPPEFRQFFNLNLPQFYQPCERGTELREVGGGSGFIVSSDGIVVTNKHVVSDTKASYTVFTNDGKKYDARILARDPIEDLAILKITASGLSTLSLGDSDSIELGQTAIAIGNALAEYRNTVSIGVVSGLRRNITASSGAEAEEIREVIQTDAAINPGNSGGPLLNLKGEVIGINTAIVSGAQNIGFAIPINRAKRDINSVKRTGEIQTPFLGVRYLTITPEVAKAQKLPVEYGALIRGNDAGPAVQPGSPAAQAGIQAEDIVLAIDGKKLTDGRTLATTIAEYDVGAVVRLTVRRGDRDIELSVTLTKRAAE